MTPSGESLAKVLDELQDVRSPGDGLLLAEVGTHGMRVSVGERTKMRKALLRAHTIDGIAGHFLAHEAPRGWRWTVIVWPDDEHVSVLLQTAR